MGNVIAMLMAFVAILATIVLFAMLLSIPTWLLWNGCLVSAIDGVKDIGLLQALGLNILFGILFKPTIKKS